MPVCVGLYTPSHIKPGASAEGQARTLRSWSKAARISSGALFRSASRYVRSRGALCKRTRSEPFSKAAAKRAGMKTKTLAGHSLRAGCVTQAAMNGVNERDIMRQTEHKLPVMLAKYVRIGQMFRPNAAAGLGI